MTQHADSTTMRTSADGAQILIEAPGFASLEVETDIDHTARHHVRGMQVRARHRDAPLVFCFCFFVTPPVNRWWLAVLFLFGAPPSTGGGSRRRIHSQRGGVAVSNERGAGVGTTPTCAPSAPLQVAIAKGGERVRARLALPDGGKVYTTYVDTPLARRLSRAVWTARRPVSHNTWRRPSGVTTTAGVNNPNPTLRVAARAQVQHQGDGDRVRPADRAAAGRDRARRLGRRLRRAAAALALEGRRRAHAQGDEQRPLERARARHDLRRVHLQLPRRPHGGRWSGVGGRGGAAAARRPLRRASRDRGRRPSLPRPALDSFRGAAQSVLARSSSLFFHVFGRRRLSSAAGATYHAARSTSRACARCRRRQVRRALTHATRRAPRAARRSCLASSPSSRSLSVALCR